MNDAGKAHHGLSPRQTTEISLLIAVLLLFLTNMYYAAALGLKALTQKLILAVFEGDYVYLYQLAAYIPNDFVIRIPKLY